MPPAQLPSISAGRLHAEAQEGRLRCSQHGSALVHALFQARQVHAVVRVGGGHRRPHDRLQVLLAHVVNALLAERLLAVLLLRDAHDLQSAEARTSEHGLEGLCGHGGFKQHPLSDSKHIVWITADVAKDRTTGAQHETVKSAVCMQACSWSKPRAPRVKAKDTARQATHVVLALLARFPTLALFGLSCRERHAPAERTFSVNQSQQSPLSQICFQAQASRSMLRPLHSKRSTASKALCRRTAEGHADDVLQLYIQPQIVRITACCNVAYTGPRFAALRYGSAPELLLIVRLIAHGRAVEDRDSLKPRMRVAELIRHRRYILLPASGSSEAR